MGPGEGRGDACFGEHGTILPRSPAVRLHIAGADVAGLGGGVVGVEVLLDDSVERALGSQDELNCVAAGTLSPWQWGNPVSRLLDLRAGVGRGNAQPAEAQDGQIDDVVANIAELVGGDLRLGENLLEGFQLVGLTLVDELHLEVAHAKGDGLALTLGNDAGAQAAEARKRDAETVVRGEALDLDARAVRLRNDGDVAVGQDAIDVEDEHFYVAGAGLRVFKRDHSAMIQAGRNGRMRRGLAGLLLVLIALAVVLPRLNHASARVAFLGDSLTWGWSFPRANLGVRGQTTAQMLERFPRQISVDRYREVVILGGTNDTLLGLDPAVTLSNLSRMVDLASAAGVHPVLAEIPPIYKENGRYLEAVDALDAGILRLAAERHVAVIDYASALRGHPGAYSDGVHLKRRGYLRMEWALLRTDDSL